MARTKKTPTEANLLLFKYERLNSDLDKQVRRQMAIFVLAPRVGTKNLEFVFGRPLGQTPFRHRSWMWYNALNLSGLGHLWPEFVERRNETACLHHALKWLQEQARQEEWALLSKRLGVELKPGHELSLNPNWWKHQEHKQSINVWTKGGVWDRRNSLTRIIILGHHLDSERDHSYNAITRALTRVDCQTIERELHNLYDPDTYLAPHIITEAIEYVRRRIPSVLGYKRETVGYKTASWFFQRRIPLPDGGFTGFQDRMDQRQTEHYPGKDLAWLPGTV